MAAWLGFGKGRRHLGLAYIGGPRRAGHAKIVEKLGMRQRGVGPWLSLARSHEVGDNPVPWGHGVGERKARDRGVGGPERREGSASALLVSRGAPWAKVVVWAMELSRPVGNRRGRLWLGLRRLLGFAKGKSSAELGYADGGRRRSGGQVGPARKGEGTRDFLFLFFISKLFSNKVLNPFEFETKLIITINKIQRHACTKHVATLR